MRETFIAQTILTHIVQKINLKNMKMMYVRIMIIII